MLHSFDDLRTLLVQELVAAVGAEELDLLVPELLIVTIELAFALRAGHPKNFCHDSSWLQSIFTAETRSTQSSDILVEKFFPQRPPCLRGDILPILSPPRIWLSLWYSI
jgi:hypothetical protein